MYTEIVTLIAHVIVSNYSHRKPRKMVEREDIGPLHFLTTTLGTHLSTVCMNESGDGFFFFLLLFNIT